MDNEAVNLEPDPPAPDDLSVLRGDYGFCLTGTFPITSPGWVLPEQVGFPWKLVASVGILTFNGKGGVKIKGVINHNGISTPPPPPETPPRPPTYSVGDLGPGTGRIVLETPALGQITLFFTMVDDWNELFLLLESPSLVRDAARPPVPPYFSSGLADNLISQPDFAHPVASLPYPLSLIPIKGGVVTASAKRMNAGSPALLKSVRITFYTLKNDKDRDTRLEVWVNKPGDLVVAYVDIRGWEFGNGNTTPVDMSMGGNTMRKSEISGSWVQLRITPSGDDTWNFRIVVDLSFDDGARFSYNFGPTTLDQDARQVNYALYGGAE